MHYPPKVKVEFQERAILICVLYAVFGFDMIPLWGTIVISVGAGVIIGIVVKLFVVPQQRTKIKGNLLFTLTLTCCWNLEENTKRTNLQY